MRALGAPGSRKVQDIMVDRRVPRELRDSWPLLAAGDDILWIIATDWKRKGILAAAGVVGTIMSNFGLEAALEREGIPFRRAAVGDRSVARMMDESGAMLGGETSGHVLLPFSPAGDGIQTALLVAAIAVESGRPLSRIATLEKVPQTLRNVRVTRRAPLEEIGSIAGALLMVAWARVEYPLGFYVLWASVGIVMAMTLYEPSFAVVAQWFDRQRNRALTAVTLMAGFASTIFLPLTSWLVDLQGWRDLALALLAELEPHDRQLRRDATCDLQRRSDFHQLFGLPDVVGPVSSEGTKGGPRSCE